jgi:hypothetical protein
VQPAQCATAAQQAFTKLLWLQSSSPARPQQTANVPQQQNMDLSVKL